MSTHFEIQQITHQQIENIKENERGQINGNTNLYAL